jgi:triosephosphate isomerase
MIAGNWKMNLSIDQSVKLVRAIAMGCKGSESVDVLVAPPFTSLAAVKEAMGNSRILLAAQNMHWEMSGAYTGEISGRMLQEAGCTHVILGHSERRTLLSENDQTVSLKAGSAGLLGLIPIICIGENLQERQENKTFEVIESHLSGSLKNFREDGFIPPTTILAYEPVWAIGTGKTATPDQAQQVHAYVRNWLAKVFGAHPAEEIRIIYGGSVTPENSRQLMAQGDIDGALVGGASLKAEQFVSIIRSEVS